jgi:hypothetical protein
MPVPCPTVTLDGVGCAFKKDSRREGPAAAAKAAKELMKMVLNNISIRTKKGYLVLQKKKQGKNEEL